MQITKKSLSLFIAIVLFLSSLFSYEVFAENISDATSWYKGLISTDSQLVLTTDIISTNTSLTLSSYSIASDKSLLSEDKEQNYLGFYYTSVRGYKSGNYGINIKSGASLTVTNVLGNQETERTLSTLNEADKEISSVTSLTTEITCDLFFE